MVHDVYDSFCSYVFDVKLYYLIGIPSIKADIIKIRLQAKI